MAKIINMIPKTKKGILLTLGITFLALVVLALATLILRNAESSEERLVELAGMDRLYNLGSSLERSVAESVTPFTGLQFNLTNESIGVGRTFYGFPDRTLLSEIGNQFRFKLVVVAFVQDYIRAVSRGVNSLVDTDPSPDKIILTFKPTNILFWLSHGRLNLTDNAAGGGQFLINHNETSPNSTFMATIVHYTTGVTDPQIVYAYDFYFASETRNGVINWSRKVGPTPGTTPVTFNIHVTGPDGYTDSATANDVYINGTPLTFPQIIYVDNLTGDQGNEIPSLRPHIRFYDASWTGALGTPSSTIVFFMLNYNEKLNMSYTMHTNTTYNELHSSQVITSQLPEFGMIRQKTARYV